MWQDVIADVANQVTSNVATDVAQRLSDIITQKLTDKFITEHFASEEMMEKTTYDGE